MSQVSTKRIRYLGNVTFTCVLLALSIFHALTPIIYFCECNSMSERDKHRDMAAEVAGASQPWYASKRRSRSRCEQT